MEGGRNRSRATVFRSAGTIILKCRFLLRLRSRVMSRDGGEATVAQLWFFCSLHSIAISKCKWCGGDDFGIYVKFFPSPDTRIFFGNDGDILIFTHTKYVKLEKITRGKKKKTRIKLVRLTDALLAFSAPLLFSRCALFSGMLSATRRMRLCVVVVFFFLANARSFYFSFSSIRYYLRTVYEYVIFVRCTYYMRTILTN